MQLDAADRAEIDIWTAGQKGLEGTARAAAAPMDATAILADEVRRHTEAKMFPWAAQEEAVRRLIVPTPKNTAVIAMRPGIRSAVHL